jgi:uncharacterized DUF497 family protein
MLNVVDLIWDEWNIRHIARHNVTPDEVTDVCRRWHVVRQSYDDRLIVIGTTETGNLLTVILNPHERGIYYPITARPASRTERRAYREEYKEHGSQIESEDQGQRDAGQ